MKVNHIVDTASAAFPKLQIGGGAGAFAKHNCALEQKYRKRKRGSEKQRTGFTQCEELQRNSIQHQGDKGKNGHIKDGCETATIITFLPLFSSGEVEEEHEHFSEKSEYISCIIVYNFA